jgi:hypothetical protein
MKRKTKNILLVSLSLVFAVTCLGLVSKINNSDPIIPPVDSSDVTTSEEPSIEASEELSSEIVSSEEQSSEEIVIDPSVNYYGFEKMYDEEHDEYKMIDKSLDTYSWFVGVPTSESYIVIDFGKAWWFYGIEFWLGTTDGSDLGDIGCIQLSTDGINWSESIGDTNVGREIDAGRDGTHASVEPEEHQYARYIKLSQINTGDTWFAIRDIYVKWLPDSYLPNK